MNKVGIIVATIDTKDDISRQRITLLTVGGGVGGRIAFETSGFIRGKYALSTQKPNLFSMSWFELTAVDTDTASLVVLFSCISGLFYQHT